MDVVDASIEVRTEPVCGAYTRIDRFQKGTSIRLVQFPEIEIRVDDVLT